MAPKPRTKTNKALPKYWRYKNGTYAFRVPPHLRDKTDGKAEISLGQDLSDAYRRFAEFFIAEETPVFMEGLFDRYTLDVVGPTKSPNTRDYKYRALARLRAAMGHNKIANIDSQFLYQYRDMIGRNYSTKQANQDLEVLSHCFTKAIEWGYIARHPMTNKQVVKFPTKGRERYVEDWELQAWAKVANPFLVVYVVLKGVTGLRQQDLLTIRKQDVDGTYLRVLNKKTNKLLRFPLLVDGQESTVSKALALVAQYYAQTLPNATSPWLFYNRSGGCYYSEKLGRASGFRSIWQRSMAKALDKTELTERFTEHDLRAKVGSDSESDIAAQTLLAHADAATTRKHYRRKGSVVSPAGGFIMKGK